jgi:hypothetical protein
VSIKVKTKKSELTGWTGFAGYDVLQINPISMTFAPKLTERNKRGRHQVRKLPAVKTIIVQVQEKASSDESEKLVFFILLILSIL